MFITVTTHGAAISIPPATTHGVAISIPPVATH